MSSLSILISVVTTTGISTQLAAYSSSSKISGASVCSTASSSGGSGSEGSAANHGQITSEFTCRQNQTNDAGKRSLLLTLQGKREVAYRNS